MVLLLVSACSIERGFSPAAQPQKSALRLCSKGRLACESPPPLLFVDGKRASWEGPDDLDPGAIETVEVVKGAMAIRLYGEAGRHGVVSITTRKPSRQ